MQNKKIKQLNNIPFQFSSEKGCHKVEKFFFEETAKQKTKKKAGPT